MVIHGEGSEGGVLPVIASQRGRRGGGPEVTGAFTRDKKNMSKAQTGRKRGGAKARGVRRIDRGTTPIQSASEGSDTGSIKEASLPLITHFVNLEGLKTPFCEIFQ